MVWASTHNLVVVNRCSLDVVLAWSIIVLVVGVPLKDCHFILCGYRINSCTPFNNRLSILTPIAKSNSQGKTKYTRCQLSVNPR